MRSRALLGRRAGGDDVEERGPARAEAELRTRPEQRRDAAVMKGGES